MSCFGYLNEPVFEDRLDGVPLYGQEIAVERSSGSTVSVSEAEGWPPCTVSLVPGQYRRGVPRGRVTARLCLHLVPLPRTHDIRVMPGSPQLPGSTPLMALGLFS